MAEPRTRIVPLKAPLEDRIAGLLEEIDAYILARAKELQAGTALPVQNIEMMLRAGICPCRTVFKIADTIANDAAIAARGKAIEDAARKAI